MKKILVSVLMLCLASFVYAENIVITSIQPLYSLTSYITKGTDIKVHNTFGSDVSMTMSREKIREDNFDISVAKNAQAVIDIAKIWKDDVIYGKARCKNINIIEIDASYPYDEKMSTLFFNNFSNGQTNYFVWLGTKNIIRMANIIAKDLIKIYPKNKEKIEKNVVAFTAEVIKEEKLANEALLNANAAEVITLTENLQYFLNDMNIFSEYINPDEITEENVANIMNERGIKVIVSDRWLKKKVIKAIKAAGGEFVVINTLDIPMDMEEKMDPDALFKAYKENTSKLAEALSK